MSSSEQIGKPFWTRPESRTLEFKETFPAGDSVARTVIAFANGAGGKLVFGIKDKPRHIIGIPDDDIFSLEEQITSHIFDLCAPNIIPEISVFTVQGKNLLAVEIYPGSHKPYYLKTKGKHDGTFIRVGSSNRKASRETIEELERQRRHISFDSAPAFDVPWHDLSLHNFISDYLKTTGKDLTDSHFENLGLMIKERGQVFPSNGAVLLSDSHHRSRLFPFAKIECARFKGTTPEVFIDQISITAPPYKAPEASLAFIKKNIALSSTIGELYRVDRWEYPLPAIREAVINAVIHRDYSLSGSDIKIAIFDDMLEITSPGTLPDTLSIEELGTGRSVIRNRILAHVFKNMGLIEAWGTGMVKIKQTVSEYPELDVSFKEQGYAFQVQFIKKSSQPFDETNTKPYTRHSLLNKLRFLTGYILNYEKDNFYQL